MTIDLGDGISGFWGLSFRKIGVGLCSNFVKHEVPMSSENKPQVMATGHMGGRLREELMKIEISGNEASELAEVHYPDM
jgi:hypothetical protein